MRIIGIDPGSLLCGYGVIDKQGSKMELIEYGVVNLKKKDEPLQYRIRDIFQILNRVIQNSKPEAAALESMFYAKNAQSLMKLAHARGVAMLACSIADLPISEYSPKEVKKSVTGNGSASKEQVQFMIRKILSIEETPEFYDATDALAVALCCGYRMNSPSSKAKGWKDFIEKNPHLVLKK
jgi:crossover junction endodeoxyribonuclease RuvC